jgi:nucleotide-binding universal stress UspA family protein
MTTSPTTVPVPSGTIVVGIDGSPGADRALGWATDQAAHERRPLTIVYSARITTGGDAMWMGQPGIDVSGMLDDIRVAGHALLDNAARRVERRAPGLVVHRVLTSADPRTALVELGERAAQVVVGSRGRGPIASALLGSVSVYVSQHTTCPVVVVRHAKGAAPRNGVVVDVDGSDETRAAVEYAYRTASFRGLPLTALLVVWDPAHLGDDEHVVADGDTGLDADRELLSEATAGMREKFPDVEDRLVLVRGLREHQLARASRSADLLVVGSHHAGIIDRFIFGSVATLVEHAACDTAVVSGGLTPSA